MEKSGPDLDIQFDFSETIGDTVIILRLHPNIWKPSWFGINLCEVIRANEGIGEKTCALELGSGSGIVSIFLGKMAKCLASFKRSGNSLTAS